MAAEAPVAVAVVVGRPMLMPAQPIKSLPVAVAVAPAAAVLEVMAMGAEGGMRATATVQLEAMAEALGLGAQAAQQVSPQAFRVEAEMVDRVALVVRLLELRALAQVPALALRVEAAAGPVPVVVAMEVGGRADRAMVTTRVVVVVEARGLQGPSTHWRPMPG
jgi:hypothetical protein